MILQILFTKIEKYQFRAAATLLIAEPVYVAVVDKSLIHKINLIKNY